MNFYSKRRKKLLYYYPLILILFVVFGLVIFKTTTDNNLMPIEEIKPKEPFVPEPFVPTTKDLSEGAWIVYWEPESYSMVETSGTMYGEEVLFAVAFDEHGNLYVPDELVELRENIPTNTASRQYLSITNDEFFDDGRSDVKTVDCLKRLFMTPKHMDDMAHKMFDMAVKFHCDGLELDIENLTKDANYWPKYVEFLKRCAYWADRYNMHCRVALGAYAPINEYDFPEELEYVVMCYALHGKFNDPGPKVTSEFLYKTVSRFSGVKNRRFAISNECFDWWPSGKKGDYNCETLTINDIYAIFEDYKGVVVHRDKDSYGLYFNYWDVDGMHTVWYQDELTMERWKELIREYNGDENTGVDLWRIELR